MVQLLMVRAEKASYWKDSAAYIHVSGHHLSHACSTENLCRIDVTAET